MKITLITPCSRPENIKILKETLNFDYILEWIIVYDSSKVSEITSFDDPKIKEFLFNEPGSIKGTSQRNYAIKQVKGGYVYFLDDDNTIHKNFYEFLDSIVPGHIYTFDQQNTRRGNNIKPYCIDTAQYLVDFDLPGVKEIQWANNTIHDGLYIEQVYGLHPNKWIYINKPICYHNQLN